MRSAIIAAAFAAGALAIPYAEKRSYAPTENSPPSYGSPGDSSPSYGSPDNSSPSYGSPEDSSPSYGSPEDSSPSYGSPEDSSPSYGSPENAPPSDSGANLPPSYGSPEVHYDVVYVTNIVTVTAGDAYPEYTPPSKHHGHKHPHPAKKPAHTTPDAAASTPPPKYEAPPPTYEAPPPTYEAPPPTYEAPPPTYEASPPAKEAPPPKEKEASPPKAKKAPPPSKKADSIQPPASDSYSDKCLFHHNLHRLNHSVPFLTWSVELAAIAQEIADTCIYAHDTERSGGGYGQNIAAGVEPANVSAVVTDLFYNAELPLFEGQFGLASPDMSNFHLWGHLTQIVWKSTTEVGCATSTNCQSLANAGSGVEPYFTVCNYKGPGNYADQYDQNVLAPGNMPTMHWDAAEKAGSDSPPSYNAPPSYRK